MSALGVSFASFEIARSGLTVNERGLTVTGHNISNVNTPGYVRQQAMITTGPSMNFPNKYGMYQFGLGADIQQIRQIRHSFLDNIYRQESTTLCYWEAKSKTFQDVQAILGEPMGAGLQSVLNQFWDSWHELSKAPDSLTARALVRQRGEALVHQFNHLGNQLDKLQNDLNSEIKVRIDEINEITAKVAKLNVEVLKTEISGDSANDYRDQRNTLVDRLSKLVNAQVMEMQDGQLDITLGGYFLVTKGLQTRLSAEEISTGGKFVVPKIEGSEIQVPVRSGSLKGLMESRGLVFGAKGSVENGSPYDKVDLVFAVNRDATPEQKADLQANMNTLVAGYSARGLNVRLGFVEYDGANISTPVYTDDVSVFNGWIGAMAPYGGASDKGYEALQAIQSQAFRSNAVKHIVMITNSPMDEDAADISSLAENLKSSNISVSVAGSPLNPDTKSKLKPLAENTGAAYYDISATGAIGFDAALSGIFTGTKDDIYNNVFRTGNIVSDLKNQLNLMINVMVRELNSLHKSGTTLNGLPGGDFFEAIDGMYPIEMGNIRLGSSLSTSQGLNYIVASVSGQNGDNTIALKIANMRHSALIGKTGETLSVDDFYRSIILNVGHNANDAMTIAENQRKLVQSADNYRQSIAGVSMDEEMANMMKFKFAYNASSRAINVIDEMLDTVINRTGIAGR
ncbi:MAG: flagellar hook-associated protein FlgK [Clostridia bacterium]|nr:flagellar hook-associated protein FlgK [Clostridia bacterium]